MSVKEAMHVVRVKSRTVSRWLKQDDRFRVAVDDAEKVSGSLLIRGGLHKLAQGYEEVVNRDEWIEKNESGDMIKRSRTTKNIAPSIQAITKLANKYHPNVYNSDSDEGNITIRITQKDRSLTIEERLRVLEGDKAPELQEVIDVDANDIRELEGLSIDPPTSE